MNKWIKSDGSIIKHEAGIIHISGAQGGVIGVSSDDVRERNGKVEVREGTTAFIVEKPSVSIASNSSLQITDGDPSAARCSKVACIALVLICCDNNKVVGACLGLGGC